MPTSPSYIPSSSAHDYIKSPFSAHLARSLANHVHTFHVRSSGNSTDLQSSAKAQSTSTFLTSLYINAAVFGAEILAFTLLCSTFKDIYQPRTSEFWPKT